MNELVGSERNLGLSVLGLMFVALVAGEVHSNLDSSAPAHSSAAPAGPTVTIDTGFDADWIREVQIEGAIRELRLRPLSIERLDLGWTPDDQVIEEYRRSGF